MFCFGLKIWSTNLTYRDVAKKLFDERVFDYIELFAVPDSYEDTVAHWKSLEGIRFTIHAPHSTVGFNPARSEGFEQNMKLAAEAFEFTEALGADIVIFHPGFEGSITETIRQFKTIESTFERGANRMVVENKPYHGILDGRSIVCNGYSPEEIRRVTGECGIGFCFDIGHGICAANAVKRNPFEYLDVFHALTPRMYHLSDGDFFGTKDMHLNIGKGNFDFKRLLEKIPDRARISLETEKESSTNLDDFVEDVRHTVNFAHKK